uniref:Pollen-specific protein like n=1 Tax=Zea mays TaxID=4577 RepID=B6UCV9_MAIZE|nr:pollen-specific protein like [Zea mays]
MDTSSPAALVNAQMLNMFVGRRVRTVVQVQHNEGGVLVGQSTDGHQLCVKSAMDVPVSHFMEVYGIAENSQTIRAEVCTDFGPNHTMYLVLSPLFLHYARTSCAIVSAEDSW